MIYLNSQKWRSFSLLLISFLFLGQTGFAQELERVSLQECHEMAQVNHPIGHEGLVLEQLLENKLQILEKEKLPGVSWNTNLSGQTDVVGLPIQVPGISDFELPYYRFQSTLDASYLIYDGGLNEQKVQIEKLDNQIAKASTEVSLEKLKTGINEAFFGILLLRQKTLILGNTLSDVKNKRNVMQAAFRQGVVLPIELDKLDLQILKIESAILEAENDAQSLVALLSDLIQEPLSEDVELDMEMDVSLFDSNAIDRPELQLFQSQKDKVLAMEGMITAARKPKFGAFLQAGVGYPNPLNFFDETISPFAMGGVKLSWEFWDWGKDDLQREQLVIQSQLIDNQKEVFEFSVNSMDGKFKSDFEKFNKLIQRDQEIIALQERIIEKVSAQLVRGVATSTDYITEVNNRIDAELNLEAHRIQLQKAQIDYLTQKGLF